jgi:Sulfotransferase family
MGDVYVFPYETGMAEIHAHLLYCARFPNRLDGFIEQIHRNIHQISYRVNLDQDHTPVDKAILESFSHGVRQLCTVESLREPHHAFSTFFNSFWENAQRISGMQIICEKTPNHFLYPDSFKTLFSQFKNIICLRDPASVIASAVKRGQSATIDEKSWFSTDPLAELGKLIRYVARLHDVLSERPPSYLMVGFEALIASPHTVSSALCNYMGVQQNINKHQDFSAICGDSRTSSPSDIHRNLAQHAVGWCQPFGYDNPIPVSYPFDFIPLADGATSPERIIHGGHYDDGRENGWARLEYNFIMAIHSPQPKEKLTLRLRSDTSNPDDVFIQINCQNQICTVEKNSSPDCIDLVIHIPPSLQEYPFLILDICCDTFIPSTLSSHPTSDNRMIYNLLVNTHLN